MNDTHRRILLLGATGATGRLVATVLATQGVAFDMAGRSLEKMAALKDRLRVHGNVHAFDGDHPETLAGFVDRDTVAINCIGPFDFFSRGILTVLAEAGAVALDVSGEQPFADFAHRELTAVCDRTGAAIANACAYESAVVDWMAMRFLDETTRYRAIESYYVITSSTISPGTLLTMRLSHYMETAIFLDGRFVPARPGEIVVETPFHKSDVDCAGLFSPYPEIGFFARRYTVSNVASYTIMPNTIIGFAKAPPRKAVTPEMLIDRHEKRGERGRDLVEETDKPFAVYLRSVDEAGETRLYRTRGNTPYRFTAELISMMAVMLRDSPMRPSGVMSPAEILDLSSVFASSRLRDAFAFRTDELVAES